MRLLLLFVLSFAYANGICQQPVAVNPLVLSNISEENGLSDDHVQCVLKDREGFVWIGTADGLNLVDGSAITIFKHHDKDTGSLISSNIDALTEDKEGNIWVGTNNGLSCYHRDRHSFSSVVPPHSPYGNSAFINTVVIDNNNRIWCSTDGGLTHYDPVKKQFTFYHNNNTGHQTNIARSNKLQFIMLDSRNVLWVCSADGLWTFDLQNLQFKKEIHRDNDPQYHELFLYVFEDHAKKIWAGDWQYGLKQLDRNTGRVINYSSLSGSPDYVSCINEIQEPGGKYVLWLNGSLLAFDPLKNKFFQFPKPLSTPEYPGVAPVFRSPDGWIWLASNKGLYIYSPRRQSFNDYFFKHALTTQGIVFTEWNNELLAGAQGKSFLNTYDTDWILKKTLAAKDLNPSHDIREAAALCFVKENDQDLWIASSEGIADMNMLTAKARWFIHKDSDSTSLPRNFITCLFFDSQKQLWVFPWRKGIWQMNTQTGKCKKLWGGFIQGPENIKQLVIASAAEDKQGNIWMADLDEGIILYDRQTQKFTKPFIKELGEQNHVSRIFYKNGFLYANSEFALLKWDPVTRQLQFLTPPAEMNKAIYDMVPDKQGNWWLCTRNGLIVFDERHNVYRRYTIHDGLVNNDISGALYCRQNGTMLIGMPDYFTSFDPTVLTTTSGKTGKVLLTGVEVNERKLNYDTTKTLQLDYRSSNILFRWALPDYANPLKNQYYSKLEGIDAGWKYVGNKGEIQYANLSPGEYRIFLKAATANGTTSTNIISVSFIIHPPYWKTTWFIFASIVVLIALVVMVVRYISRRNLKEKLLGLEKEQAVEKERNRISRDMHDDLGSGLTKIAIMSEVVKKQIHEPEKAKQQLDNISTSSRELVDNLQDIIWILNPKNDTLESLASYIREYGLKFFESSGTALQFNYPEKFSVISLSEETRRNIFLAIKESFGNIAKHAWCNNVAVTIIQDLPSLTIKIEDDGRGFDKSNVRLFSNGLTNMKTRILQIGGSCQIESVPGKGTRIIIKVNL